MPGIFPQSSEEIINTNTISRSKPSYGKSPVFDFEKGEFKTVDGKVYMGEGIEVLKNWIEKTLRTERYRFLIYSFNYGVTLEELVAKDIPFEVLVNELEHQITDALMQDARIAKVSDFKFSKDKSLLHIQFEVTTFDKEVFDMEVRI